ncbi:MAG: DUF4143 domain-containing protein [Bacilli bacterium]
MKEYYKRIFDRELSLKLKAFGAVLIEGPKWCGKTTTAKQLAKSYIEMQDPEKKTEYFQTANISPSLLLIGEKPRLIDEWQMAPSLWDAVRVSVDRISEPGQYILTGSNSVNNENISHSGTGRIDRTIMYPMSLYESRESNGTISLLSLFNDKAILNNGCISNLSITDLVYATCRGGWPAAVMLKDKEASLSIAKSYLNSVCKVDVSSVDKKTRDESLTKMLLRSYARNISTFASNETVLKDINSNYEMSKTSYYDYVNALKKLYIIQDVEAWCPAIRSKAMIQASNKKELIDPSLVVASLGLKPEYFNTDLKTFGFIFETLVCRDLRIYASSMGGQLSYYHDRYGLESDFVLHLEDGRFALIEVKLGSAEIEDGAKHLLKIEKLIIEYNLKEKQCPLRLPDLKIIITGGQYGYKREDGVFVIPIGCLKD